MSVLEKARQIRAKQDKEDQEKCAAELEEQLRHVQRNREMWAKIASVLAEFHGENGIRVNGGAVFQNGEILSCDLELRSWTVFRCNEEVKEWSWHYKIVCRPRPGFNGYVRGDKDFEDLVAAIMAYYI